MGITTQAAKFAEATPSLEAVLVEASRLSGLELTCRRLARSALYEFHAEIAFACHTSEREEVFAYNREQLRRFEDEQLAVVTRASEAARRAAADSRFAAALSAFSAAIPTGFEPTIYVRGSVGEEGTLRSVLALALESLGGSLLFPMSPAARALGSAPLTEALIRSRHREHRQAWMRALAKLPLYVMGRTWRLLSRGGWRS